MNKGATVRYDAIGHGYVQHRAADPCIVTTLLHVLDLPSGATVADVGAGTGAYAAALAMAGYQVLAIEPAATMRAGPAPPADNLARGKRGAVAARQRQRGRGESDCAGVMSKAACRFYGTGTS